MGVWQKALRVIAVYVLGAAGLAAGERGLVAHYSFDEGQGAIAHDKSGHENHGKIIGAKWVAGPYGTALSFDGVDDFVDCGSDESLRVESAASVVVWIRPKVCQGGLVNWSVGGKWQDERLVLSFKDGKEFSVCMATGRLPKTRAIRPSDVVIYKSKRIFPPVDVWTHFAIAFDGRSMIIYKDGAFVDILSPEEKPNLKDVPTWIGKSLGLGANYFNGLIDGVRIYNREISAEQILALYKADAEKRGKDTKWFNKVRVEATAYPIQGRIVANLDFHEMWPTPEGMSIEADLLDAAGVRVMKGTLDMLPVRGLAEAQFGVPSLTPGEYKVRVVAKEPGGETIGEESQADVTWTKRPEVFTRIKVLNNLCWELLNVAPGDRPAAEYSFPNPRRGWVYFSTEAEAGLTLSVPGAEPAVIHSPTNGAPRQEAMRFLPEGEYTVVITGEGALKKLVARSVPTLMFSKIGQRAKVQPLWIYDWDFLAPDILRNSNSLVLGSLSKQQLQHWVDDLGGLGIHEIPAHTLKTKTTTTEDVYNYLISQSGFTKPFNHGVIADEFGQGNEGYFVAWAEASEKILSDPKYAGRMIIPYCGSVMYDYKESSEFIRTVIRHGSYFARERYLWEQPSEDKAWLYIRQNLADEMPHWEAGIPGATSHMIVCLGYMSTPPQGLNIHPTVSFKVFMDMEFQHLATHPDFFGVGGIMEYNAAYCDEENIRWQGRLFRHYALEGGTGRLSSDPYVLPHVRNPDFDGGTESWTIQAAATGSVQAKSHEGYSHRQGRYRPTPQGDTFLWTKRSAKTLNIFSQRITALRPGQLYSMKMLTADYQNVVGKVSDAKRLAVSVQLINVEAFTDPDKHFQSVLSKYPPHLNYHWYVFRALGETAELIISDWQSDANPGGPIGQEIVYNFIEIQPYLGD